jgi:hypothetical protein
MLSKTKCLLLLLLAATQLPAQILLENVGGVFPLDLCTCTQGPVVYPDGTGAIALGPSPNPYLHINNQVFQYNPTTGVSTLVGTLPPGFGTNNMVYGPDNLLYLVCVDPDNGSNWFLYAINPANSVVTNLGQMPLNSEIAGDLFFFNGLLYGAGLIDGVPGIMQIPLNNPGLSSIFIPLPDLSSNIGTASFNLNGQPTVLITGYDSNYPQGGIFTLNMNTGEYTLLCPNIVPSDMAAWVNGNITTACCVAEAGTFAETTVQTFCQNLSATLTHNGDEQLGSGIYLSFVLSSSANAATLPTGVIATGTAPVFSFNPATMSLNTLYYIAAVAAPGAAGAPDWSSSCKDVSLLVPVMWKPLPTVSFAPTGPPVCGESCVGYSFQLAGAFPITLDWSLSPASGASLSGSWQATGSPATFQICPPAGGAFPPGPLVLNLTGISDAFCSCP